MTYQDNGSPVDAKADLHTIVCVRQFFRFLRCGAAELKQTDCVGPAVEVEENHELNRLGQWHFSRIENPDVDQQIVAFTAKIHHGDVSSHGRKCRRSRESSPHGQRRVLESRSSGGPMEL